MPPGYMWCIVYSLYLVLLLSSSKQLFPLVILMVAFPEGVCAVACVDVCAVCDSEQAPEDEDDLYAAVYGMEDDYAGGEIYEDLMRTELQPPLVLQ